MKKILLVSVLFLAGLATTSCSEDSVNDTTVPQTVQDDTGGQSGNIPPPPPPRGLGGKMQQSK